MCAGPHFSESDYGRVLSKALADFDTCPLDTRLLILLPHRTNAPWSNLVSYFDTLYTIPSGTEGVFSTTAGTLPPSTTGYKVLYKDSNTTIHINP